MNWTHTLWHWYPCLHSACACACLPRTLALILVQRLTRPLPAPGLPGHSCNRFFIVWIIEFIAPGQSSKVPKPLLLIVIPLLNQTCYPFVNHRQSDCHAHWTASASHKLCHLVNPDRVQSPLLFFACVLPDLQNLPKWPEPYTHKNYQCFFADKTGQKQSCELPELHQNLRFAHSWLW